jgi:UDPglucose 6-dehydrogenase
LRGGVAYGGPCFPRDNKAFAALARSLRVRCDIAEATDAINDHQVQRLFGAVAALAGRGARVAVLGLSYKLHTPVVEKSQGLALARLLAEEGYRVIIADPLAAAAAQSVLGGAADVAGSFEDAVRGADVVVITTPWPQIRHVAPSAFTRPIGRLPVIDPWGVLSGSDIMQAARVISLGRGGYRAGAQDDVGTLVHSGMHR